MCAGARSGGVLEPEELAETVETLRAIGNLDRWLAPDRRPVPAPGRPAPGRRRVLGGRRRRSRGASTTAARSSTPPAAGSPPCGARSARSRSESRRRSGRCSARPRSSGSSASPISRWSGTITSCPSPRTTAARSRARSSAPAPATRRSTSSPPAIGEQSAQLSFLRAREGEGGPPDPALAQRPGRPWWRRSLLGTLETMAELDLIHARGTAQPRLSDVGPALQPGRRGWSFAPPGIPCSKHSSGAIRRWQAGRRRAAPPASRPPPAAGDPMPAEPRPACRLRPRRARARAERTVVPIDVNLGRPVSDPGRDRPEHRRQDGGAQDGRPAGDHGPVRLARPGRRGLAVPDLRRRAGRHRRRAEPGAVALDLLVARAADQRDPGQGDVAARWCCSTSWGPAPTRPTARALGRAILDELCRIGMPRDRDDAHRRPEDLRASRTRAPRTPPSSSTTRRSSRSIGCTSATSASRTPSRSRGSCSCPSTCVARAESYLAERQSHGVPDWEVLQKLRKEARRPAQAALDAQAEAERTREALAERLAQLQAEAQRTVEPGRRARPAPARRPGRRPAARLRPPGPGGQARPAQEDRHRRDRPCHLGRLDRRAGAASPAHPGAGRVAQTRRTTRRIAQAGNPTRRVRVGIVDHGANGLAGKAWSSSIVSASCRKACAS